MRKEYLEAPIYASIYTRDYRFNDEKIPSVETFDIEKIRETFVMYKGIVREDKIEMILVPVIFVRIEYFLLTKLIVITKLLRLYYTNIFLISL